jgi:hypothetical protein
MGLIGWVSLAASVVNALTVVVLAILTFGYAQSAKRQADAARAQATAAGEQALAAQRTLEAISAQEVGRVQADRTTVNIAILSAIRIAEYWTRKDTLITLSVRRALPEHIYLLPALADAAVECAIRMNQKAAVELANAFDYLRLGQMRIESMRSTPVAEDVRYHTQYADDATEHIRIGVLTLRELANKLGSFETSGLSSEIPDA